MRFPILQCMLFMDYSAIFLHFIFQEEGKEEGISY